MRLRVSPVAIICLVYLLVYVLVWNKWLTLPWLVPVIFFGGFLGLVIPRATQLGAELYLAGASFNQATLKIFFASLLTSESERESRLHVSHLIHSYLFLFAYFAAALFVVTSTQYEFGKAAVLGCGLRLMYELVESRMGGTLKERWFTQFPARLSSGEMDIFVVVCLVAFAVVSILGMR